MLYVRIFPKYMDSLQVLVKVMCHHFLPIATYEHEVQAASKRNGLKLDVVFPTRIWTIHRRRFAVPCRLMFASSGWTLKWAVVPFVGTIRHSNDNMGPSSSLWQFEEATKRRITCQNVFRNASNGFAIMMLRSKI